MQLFSLNASAEFAERVATRLGIGLSAHEEREFGDREFKVRPLESVRGEQVFVLQSLYSDTRQSANDKLCRLLFFVGALKDAGAAEVDCVIPYLAYSRKDRRTKSRDPITTRYLATILEAVGADAVITADVHNLAAFENAYRCQKLNLEAAPLFADHFRQTITSGDLVVALSPDAGGVKRARVFMESLAAALARPVGLGFMAKSRSEGQVGGEEFAGDVAGAAVIIIDDLISGGTTMTRTAIACKERGARSVHAAATHGIFGPRAETALGSPEIDSVVVTNTVADARERCPGLAEKLVVLDSTEMFADAIRHFSRGRNRAGSL